MGDRNEVSFAIFHKLSCLPFFTNSALKKCIETKIDSVKKQKKKQINNI